jgi:Uma2 family endonuclease
MRQPRRRREETTMAELRVGPMTVADLDALLDEPGTRYELFDGELHVSKQPHFGHQVICTHIAGALWSWNEGSGLGFVFGAPGVVFGERDAAAPDIAWASHTRLSTIIGESAALEGAPELVVEVLSPGAANQRRDREIKLRVYSRYGVDEYWLVDPAAQTIAVYRRGGPSLQLAATLGATDTLTSPLLPGFSVALGKLFRRP